MPTYLAPTLSICSFTSGRTSVAKTLAPSRRAVAMACRPATAAPITNTLAGNTMPAAVVRRDARAGLDCDRVPRLHELLAGLGHQGDTALSRPGLLGNRDLHSFALREPPARINLASIEMGWVARTGPPTGGGQWRARV